VVIAFDGDGVDDAGAHLARRADTARALVASAAGLDRHLADRHLALAALALADLTGDTADLVALDLQLLATRVLAGSRLLTDAELRLAGEEPA
jgi:hypothetical protein